MAAFNSRPLKIASILLGLFLGTFTLAGAVSTFTVQQGGTGGTNFASSTLVYGAGTMPFQSVATTSVTCSGSVSCTSFNVLGASPITISSSGGSGSVSTSTNGVNGQITFFTADSATPEPIGGSSNLTWNNTNSYLSLSSTTALGTRTLNMFVAPLAGGALSFIFSTSTANPVSGPSIGYNINPTDAQVFANTSGGGFAGLKGGTTESTLDIYDGGANTSEFFYGTQSNSFLRNTGKFTLQPTTDIELFAGNNLYLSGGSDSSVFVQGLNSDAIFNTSQLASSNKSFYFPNVSGDFAIGVSTTTGQLPYWGNPGLYSVATSSWSVTGPFNMGSVGALVGGSGNITYWGLATTSQPASSNLLVSNGAAGVFGVATGTVSAGSSAITVTAGRSVIGGALSIDCATASGSQAGCLSTTDWTTFNNKISWGAATSTSPNQFVYTDPFGKLISVASSSIKLSGFNNDAGFIAWGAATSTSANQNVYTNAFGKFVSAATSTETCTSPLSCTSFDVLKNGGAISLNTNGITYSLIQQVSANRLLGNSTGAAANVAEIATSTLFGATTPGYVLSYQGGANTWVATTTFNSPLSYTQGAVSLGTVTVGFGGTGLTSIADGNLLYGGAGGGTANLVALATTSGAGRVLSLDYTTGRPSWVATSTLGVASAGLSVTTETPSGTINGTNAAFTVNNNPAWVVLNGATQSAGGNDYTLTGSGPYTITFVNAPTTGSNLTSYYTTTSVGNIGAGIAGQFPYYAAAGSTLTATSALFLSGTNLGIGTTTPNWALNVAGTRPSLALTDTNGTFNNRTWLFSSQNGNLYIGTTTDAGSYSTSTPPALAFDNSGDLGLSTSTPFAQLSIVNTESAQALFAVASSSLPGAAMPVFEIDQFGHLVTSGPLPVVSACGTNPSVSGNDQAGAITTGTGGPTSCTMTFANTYGTAPVCVITGAPPSGTRRGLALISSTTATKLSFLQGTSTSQVDSGMTSWVANYICVKTQ